MGLFGDIGGIIGAIKAKKSSKKAAAAQIAAQQKAVDELNRQFGVTAGQYAPYQQQGTAALAQQGNLIGTGGADAQAAAIQQLQNSPYFQSLYRQGTEATLQNAAATGGIRGGNTERSLADFGHDALSQAIQQQLQNLGGLSTMGYNATAGLGQLGANNAGNVAGLYVGQGDAKAQDYLRRANINAQMWKAIGGLGDQAASFIAGGFGAPGGGFNLGAAMGSSGGQSMFGGL